MARGGPLQEQLAQNLRQMVHDKAVSGVATHHFAVHGHALTQIRAAAEALAKEEWVLRSMAKALTEGSDNTRAHICACFRCAALQRER